MSKTLFAIGYIAGILMAFLCLAFAIYYFYQYQAINSSFLEASMEGVSGTGNSAQQNAAFQQVISIHMFTTKAMLHSCGVAAGLAFGFLGFCLFLLGIEGQITAEAQSGADSSFKVESLAPGAFVLLISALLIGICATDDIPFRTSTDMEVEGGAGDNAGDQDFEDDPGMPIPEPVPLRES